ncbi:MAG: hypothetical protein ABIG93_03740 [archaeon]|nr:hypothetical protein [Nanoarchaeota archaeon]
MAFRIKKGLLVVSLVLLVFLLASCNRVPAGEEPMETSVALAQVQSGTEGLKASFVTGYPPSKIYDINDFVAIVELENKGNYDLSAYDCYLQITGFDANIIRGINYVQSCGDIDGKSVYNLDGGYNQVQWESSNIDLPTGTYEYSPNLNLVMCYNYQTRTSPSVCVDPLFYQITSEQKACTPQNVMMGGGQGAPVSVSYVGVEMTGDTAIFEISVRNSGNGRVLSPYADIVNCGEASLDYDDLDKILYNVEMTGGSLIKCTPSDWLVRMSNDAGKIICSFRINGATAFETPLQITLDYNYIENLQKSIQIIETP